MRILCLPVALSALALSLSLFSFGGGGGGSTTPPSGGDPEPSYVRLSGSRLDGGTSSEFQFEAQLFGPVEPTEITWDFGDGQTAQGVTSQVVYPVSGVYTVTATADFPEGDPQMVALDVAVSDPLSGDVLIGTDLSMPTLLGDVDDDLSLTMLDVALIQDHVNGVTPLDASQWRTADFALDGVVDQRDVDLLTESVSLFGALPNSVEPATGPRGTMVQIMSEYLRDVDALVEVRVGLAPPRPIRRLHPGYGLFLVPMDAAGPATSQPIAAGPTFVELVVDGNTVHAFDFELTNPAPIMGDEISLLRESGHDLHQATMALQVMMAEDFEALGTTAEDRILLRALVNAAAADFARVASEIDALTENLTLVQRDGIAYMCSVSGLREVHAAMQGTGLLSGGLSRMGGAGSPTVDLIVGLREVIDLAAVIDRTVQTACLAASDGLVHSSFWMGPYTYSITVDAPPQRDLLCGLAISISSLELGPAEVVPSNGGSLSSSGGGLLLEFACGNSGVTSVEIRSSLPVVGAGPFLGVATVPTRCPNGWATPGGMAAIPAGSFLMGSNAVSGAPYYGHESQRPVHQVLLSYCFWMGQHEVTQAEYQALLGSNPSSFQGASLPVETVSWYAAQSYCTALTAQQAAQGQVPPGYEYRLPTEAEWEYACRAGTTTEFHYGPALFCGDARFWYSEHSSSSCNSSNGPRPVGSYAPNAFGLYDMHGNVWEWCLDSYADYTGGSQVDPFVTGGSYRVIRGGSWYGNSGCCRSAYRLNYVPGSAYGDVGFRVVLAPVLTP